MLLEEAELQLPADHDCKLSKHRNEKDLLVVTLEDGEDVTIGRETWLNPEIGNSKILPPTYKNPQELS